MNIKFHNIFNKFNTNYLSLLAAVIFTFSFSYYIIIPTLCFHSAVTKLTCAFQSFYTIVTLSIYQNLTKNENFQVYKINVEYSQILCYNSD